MARLHAVTLGRVSTNALAKMGLALASTALAASCSSAPWAPVNSEHRTSGRRVIYLETSEFRWVDAKERQQLACANGTVVVCSTSLSRLSLANCGCLPPR